jgi:hypothetical protein
MLRPRHNAILPFAAISLSLAGCQSAGDYPSLALRDFERVQGSAQPVAAETEAPPAPPPPSADLTTQIDALVRTARESHARFTGRTDATERAVSAGAGAASTSDRWVSAQVALAELQTLGAATLSALADLDEIYVTQREASPGTETPSIRAVEAARGEVSEWVAAETDALTRIEAKF